jgi:hypothetical protein
MTALKAKSCKRGGAPSSSSSSFTLASELFSPPSSQPRRLLQLRLGAWSLVSCFSIEELGFSVKRTEGEGGNGKKKIVKKLNREYNL